MGTAPVWGQQLKSPCEAHGMVRWGSPETPSQSIYDGYNMVRKKETVEEYLKRGGKVENLSLIHI